MNNISKALIRSYKEEPGKAAIYLQQAGKEDLTITYNQLVEDSTPYVQAFQELGIEPGKVIILILQHGKDLLNAYFGSILAGIVPSIMPFLTEKLQPERYRTDLSSLISITKPDVIITYPEFQNEVREVVKKGEGVKALLTTKEINQWEKSHLKMYPGSKRRPEDIVLLQHSSGTTGLQKGVALSHQAIFNQLESYNKALKVSKDDVIVSWLPLYHDMGLIAGFLMPIIQRIPLVLMSPFDWVRAPQRLLNAISEYKGTLCWLPNFAYNFCAKKIRDRHIQGIDLSSLRAVINCSEPMHYKSHELFYNRFKDVGFKKEALTTCYAMAENVFAVTQGGIESHVIVDEINRKMFQQENIAQPTSINSQSIKMLSAGKPIENVMVRIISNKGKYLPDRHIGEIIIKSNCMLTGYYHRPEETEISFVNGWFRTGDLGYLANGELFISGRKKDLIIVGGKNIYPQDLETLAMEVYDVHAGRVVAFGVFNENFGTEEVIIVAEIDNDCETDKKQIDAEIRRVVSRGSAVILKNVHLVGKKWLIKTSSGKIARAANKEKYLLEVKNESY
ncbi:MAG TPA: fatty acyl-AMP ligase [Anaerolineae bacterium]|nr:fatty acyl-AMP ligase [Anaerolineae bacterium]